MYTTSTTTYITVPDGQTKLLKSVEAWTRATLILETAGPVAIGTQADISPVLSGKGVLLESTGEPVQLLLARGNRLYIASDTLNRVKVIFEPIPWYDQILRVVGTGFAKLLMQRKHKKDPPKTPTCPPGVINGR